MTDWAAVVNMTRSDLTEELISDVIAEGDLDYIEIGDIGHLIILATGAGPEGLHARAAAVAADMVRRGLLVPGVIEDGFQPWDLAPNQAAARVLNDANELLRHTRLLAPGLVCWFDITDKALREYPPPDDGLGSSGQHEAE